MSNPPPPREMPVGFLYEMAFLVDRGVRPIALVTVDMNDPGLQLRTKNLVAMSKPTMTLDVVYAEIEVAPGIFEYIFARTRRVAEAYEAMMDSTEMDILHKHTLRGLLFGYDAVGVDRWVHAEEDLSREEAQEQEGTDHE